MTYNVFSGTLNPTHSLTHAVVNIPILSCVGQLKYIAIPGKSRFVCKTLL